MEIEILDLHLGTWLSECKRNVGFRAGGGLYFIL